MPDIGKAYVQIVPSASGIKGQVEGVLGKDMDGAGKSSGQKFGSKLVSTATKILATAQFGKVIGNAFNASAELEQNVGGIKKIYGEAAQTVATNAQKAFKTVQMSSNDYLGMATSFGAALIKSTGGDYQKSAQQAQKAISQISDNYNTFGGDLENLKRAYMNFAKGNFTMLDNLNLGFGGSKQGMQDLLKEAEKISGKKFDIGNFTDIVDAIDVVQEHLGILGTSSKEAATTLEGSKNMMVASWQNVLSTIGMATKGEVTDMGFQWKTALGGMVESMTTFGKNAIPALSSIVEALPTVIVQAVTTGLPLIVSGGLQIITSLVNGITQAIPLLASEAPKMITQLMNALITGFPQLIQAGAELIHSLITGVVQNIPQFMQTALPMLLQFSQVFLENMSLLITCGLQLILALVQGLMQSLPTLIAYVPQIVTNVFDVINQNIPMLIVAGVQLIVMLVKGIVQAIPSLLQNFPQIFQMILSVWSALNWTSLGKHLITFIKNGVSSLASAIPNALKNIGTTAKNFFTNIPWRSGGNAIINFIKNGIQNLASAIPNALKSIGSKGLSAFRNLSWSGVGRAIVQGIKNGVANAGGALVSALRSLANRALSAAKKALRIGSPSKVFASEIGRWIPEGVAVGISANVDPVQKAVDNMGDLTANNFQAQLSTQGAFKPGAFSDANTTNYGGVTINVYATENQSVSEIAQEVQKILVNSAIRETAVFA